MKLRKVTPAGFPGRFLGIVPGLVLGLLLGGCAGSYRVVQVPEHAADLYPLSQTRAGITIAVDEIRNAARAQRHFGANLIKEGILPVNVVLSNYGKQRVVVKPSDVLLYRGKEIIDPLPYEIVAANAKRQHRFLQQQTEEEIDKFFSNSMFKETVLAPNETYRGVVFYAVPAPAGRTGFFSMLNGFSEGGPTLRVGLTDVDNGQRLLFGPFSVSTRDVPARFSYGSY